MTERGKEKTANVQMCGQLCPPFFLLICYNKLDSFEYSVEMEQL